MSDCCFHCGEPVPKGFSGSVIIDAKARAMCCIGCQAVAQTIVDNNLSDYYRFRSEPAQKGAALVPEQLQKQALLDEEALQSEFTTSSGEQGEIKETILTIEGISCAACAWLIERQLAKCPGVNGINVNATTQRATVSWQQNRIKLSDIINTIAGIGYQALPFKAHESEQRNKRQAKAFIRRLGISGILMMQVMMIAIGLYFGAFADMESHNLIYLRWASMLLTIPVISYGALPFYRGALNALKLKRLTMDVPVSIAIILSFSASAWATLTRQGEVYFESVAMFTFLLLIGKFLEFRARARAAEVSANLLKLMPMTATRLVDDKECYIAAKNLQPDDVVIVKPGEIIPADGIISAGSSQVNEAMLSGEQMPVNKQCGDKVFAGTVNSDGNLQVTVSSNNQQSFLHQLIRLSEQSQAHKPKIAQLSDTIAQYFVAVILLTAIATAVYWSIHQPELAFWITLSVLVATCPCALSLATPTALTCATTRLNKDGIMIKSSHVMETLPKIDCIAFDKTGTLTTGKFSLEKLCNLSNDLWSDQQLLALIAALEAHSEHPLAKAFIPYRDFTLNATDVSISSGFGVSGTVNGQHYQLGKADWLLQDTDESPAQYRDSQCVLVSGDRLLAAVYLQDQVRPQAKELLAQLNAQHIHTVMISGDSAAGCTRVAQQLPINEIHGQMSADGKLKQLKTLQQQYLTAMVGDGVNDSPVFGAAHVSIAMGSGTDIAKTGADVILLNNDLASLSRLQRIAKKTRTIILENYLWAFGYNAIILPLAVSGHVTPYLAVIGMSASSILVVTNSLRLLKK